MSLDSILHSASRRSSCGLITSLTVLALFLSYSMLNVCDLSTDGCFTLGATVGAVVAIAGHPYLSIAAAMAAGIASGFITAILQTKMGINSLLAGIIVNTGLYSINIAVMSGSSILNMNKTDTVFTKMAALVKGTPVARQSKLFVAIIAVAAVAVILGLFLKTRLGLAIRATGDNPDMVRSSSVNPGVYYNNRTLRRELVHRAVGLPARPVAEIGQHRYRNRNGDDCPRVRCLSAACSSAERKMPLRIFGMVLGAFIFRLVYTIALRFDMPAFMLKFVSSVIVIAAIAITLSSKNSSRF